MALPDSEKLHASVAMAGALAAAAANSSYSHCGWITRDGCRKIANGAERPSAWDGLEFDAIDSPLDAARRLPPVWRPRGIRVFISDLMYLGDPLTMLSLLADRASMAVVVQVLAADDVHPARRGNCRLLDSETGEMHELFIDAAAERKYHDALTRHQQNWLRASQQVGAQFITLVAEDFCKSWDLGLLVAKEILKV